MDQRQYTGLLDMLNGGGPGAAGQTFEGGPLSGLLNLLGIRPMGYMDRLAEARPMQRPSGLGVTPRPAPTDINAVARSALGAPPARPQPRPIGLTLPRPTTEQYLTPTPISGAAILPRTPAPVMTPQEIEMLRLGIYPGLGARY